MTRLALSKQVNLNARPKFNTFNFERHIQYQHVNKKRKFIDENMTPLKKIARNETLIETVFCDISEDNARNQSIICFNPRNTLFTSTPNSSPFTPKTKKIQNLQNELSSALEKIRELENIPAISNVCASSSSLLTPKTARLEKLTTDLRAVEKKAEQLQSENIMIRHKFMDSHNNIRTICRIKPESTACFTWKRSEDGTNIELRMYCIINM